MGHNICKCLIRKCICNARKFGEVVKLIKKIAFMQIIRLPTRVLEHLEVNLQSGNKNFIQCSIHHKRKLMFIVRLRKEIVSIEH